MPLDFPNAKSALRQINGWLDEYNEIYPHSALNMNSPRMFRRVLNQ
ncbi:hypothetical protein H3S84_03450 [Bartonella sp. W8098]|nr:hypothetical protein [Bartonella apis]MBI0171667.1 hypothetical protein [Bartonella sp. W8151]